MMHDHWLDNLGWQLFDIYDSFFLFLLCQQSSKLILYVTSEWIHIQYYFLDRVIWRKYFQSMLIHELPRLVISDVNHHKPFSLIFFVLGRVFWNHSFWWLVQHGESFSKSVNFLLVILLKHSFYLYNSRTCYDLVLDYQCKQHS